MNQDEKRLYLINRLLEENKDYSYRDIPQDSEGQWKLLRSLMNVRPAWPIDDEFLRIQDEYLKKLIEDSGITDADTLPSTALDPRLKIWRGDITTLKVDAIVNAANNQMEGCWLPCHACIDNCIHTFSGIQLRLACHDFMVKQGYKEPTGQAKITPAFNLPSKYVLHTVGPIITHTLTQNDCDLLASCYTSCLRLAEENGLNSIAFCCISTGVFRFPQEKAAEIAVKTVKEYLDRDSAIQQIVFNVFGAKDEIIYRNILD